MRQVLLVSFSAALLVAACASYTPSSAPIPDRTSLAWSESDGLAVSADPFVEAERQTATFDADLNEADVIAIQVSVENRTERNMLVRPSDMQLMLPRNRVIAPSGITTTVNKIGENGSVVGATIAFGLIGALAASNAEENARTARTANYREKAFDEAILAKGEWSHGFVFFIPPQGTEPFDEAKLRVRFVDFDSAKSEMVEVGLVGLGYEETKEAKSRRERED